MLYSKCHLYGSSYNSRPSLELFETYLCIPFARMSHTIKYFTLFDFDVLNIKLRFIFVF